MVTGEMVEELILTGADIIKVGIGPGMSFSLLGQLLSIIESSLVWLIQTLSCFMFYGFSSC